MAQYSMSHHLGYVVLAVLLTLPIAQMAAPVEAKKRPRAVTQTYRDAAPITIPVAASYPAPALLYPSPIVVKGANGAIRDVDVRLNAISHDDPDEIQVLLVGPGGQTAIVMAGLGGEEPVAGVTLRLDDEAAAPLPDAISQSGVYRPTNDTGSAIAFNAPAPSVTSTNAALSVFDGTPPNGTWNLFVQDAHRPSEAGVFAGGWALEITTKAKARKKR
jgi:subtilisin-like proprotein convertase family protein